MCCVWHSTIASVSMEPTTKTFLDKIMLGVFASVFISVQVIFTIGIFSAYKKIQILKRKEASFIKQVGPDDSDDEDS